MLQKDIEEKYICILEDELVPAMGCTEPIAIAYVAALARKTLGVIPDKVELIISSNIIKNVKSVVVPHTGGLKGIGAAAAAGIVAGDADGILEVLSNIEEDKIPVISEYMKNTDIGITPSDSGYIFEIIVKAEKDGHKALIHAAGNHTNIIEMVKDEEVLLKKEYNEDIQFAKPYRDLLTVERIIEFADNVDISKVKNLLDRQIAYNTAIAEEGLKGKWGAGIGKILMDSYGDTVFNRAKAMAAAGADARMSGCEMPVIINSGSGNQGMATSLPVIVYAKELKVEDDLFYRALLVANLVTIHMKTGIGCLSAYCGATSAGCGAAAGITYLYGGKLREIAHTIVNAVAINSGMICDGAKPSCAAKIASAIEAGLLGMQMQMHGSQFYGGDGIIVKGVENTIANISRLAVMGMSQTDKEIIQIMVE
ncbi:MAG: serine dehydratase subunit alpha family protein [Lachnospiraceae bacterium]|nr:serine dehydratase subunit alpha family protein [Lachnospiraceae bacterium]